MSWRTPNRDEDQWATLRLSSRKALVKAAADAGVTAPQGLTTTELRQWLAATTTTRKER